MKRNVFFSLFITGENLARFTWNFPLFVAKSQFFANQFAGRASSRRFSMHRKVVWVEMFTKTGRWKFAEFHHQLSVFIKRLKTRTFIVILYNSNDSYLSFRDKTSASGLPRIGFEYIISLPIPDSMKERNDWNRYHFSIYRLYVDECL